MSGWLKSLVGYMLIVSVVMQMLPNEKYERYVKLFTGFLLIIFILQPVLKIGSVDSYLADKIAGFVQEQELLEENIGEMGELFEQESEKMQEQPSDRIEIQPVKAVEVVIDD